MSHFILLVSFVVALAIGAVAQISVPLRLDPLTPTTVYQGMFCDAKYVCGVKPGEDRKIGSFGKRATPISVRRNGDGFLFSVDTNGKLGLADERAISIARNGNVLIRITRQVAKRRFVSLPYVVKTDHETEGVEHDSFSIQAHYVLRGRFRSGRCVTDFAVNDMAAEGKIDPSNATAGTNLLIDRNKDGKFWGKGEFSKTNEIVELCGQNYLVTALNYSRIVFERTDLKLARVGEKVVDFSFELMNGTKVTAASLNGKPYILDFWASWCVPCVGNLPLVKQLHGDFGDKVAVFSVNVDKNERRNLAEQIIDSNALGEFSSIRGMGENDPTWKAFGGSDHNHLAIPLYVLVDRDGIVRYAANGGDKLADLKGVLETVLKAR